MGQRPGESEDREREAIEETASEIAVFDLRALTHFQDERPYVQVLSESSAARVLLFAFQAGQQLKEHRTSSQILVQALRGRITFTSEGSSVDLHAGMLLQLEADIPHSVVARTNAVMLLTMTPNPLQAR
jgi:quercetin dioxygenase-like cupin family protein